MVVTTALDSLSSRPETMAAAIQLVVLCLLLLPCVTVSVAELNGELGTIV